MSTLEQAFATCLGNGTMEYPGTGNPMHIRVQSTTMPEGANIPPEVREMADWIDKHETK